MAKKFVIDGVIGWDVEAWQLRSFFNRANGEDVTIEIASPGGFVYDGIEIFNVIRNYTGGVTTKIIGLAASMASYIALAGDIVTAEDNAVYMIHNVWGGAIGEANDLRKAADEMEGLTNLLADKYAKKTGKDVAEIRSMMDAESFFFGPEILEAGFVDEIIETDKEKNKTSALTESKTNIKGCLSKMKEKEQPEKDIEKAAAWLGGKPKNEIINKNDNVGRVHKPESTPKEESVMDLKELQSKHSDLVDQIKAQGVTEEKQRISSLLAWSEKNPITADIVKNAIESGKSVNEALPELMAIVSTGVKPAGDEQPGEINSNVPDGAANAAGTQKPKAEGETETKEEAEKQEEESLKNITAGINVSKVI
jgi:ATP-dependent Clp endopeptidase proteolytic subunit ClpP